MSLRSGGVSGRLVHDSVRGSLVVVVSHKSFVASPVAERRACGVWRDVVIASRDDSARMVDRFVTGVMVAWAVALFVGMSYLAVVI